MTSQSRASPGQPIMSHQASQLRQKFQQQQQQQQVHITRFIFYHGMVILHFFESK